MWHSEPNKGGYYWYKYRLHESTQLTVCYFDFFSKTITFIGSIDSTPIEHLNSLEELTGLWFGPIKEPPLKD